MKTFTTYAEKKAKQFLNLLQGYTKGIRITAILILLLMGVSNAWGAKIAGETKLYLEPNANWKADNARFAAYFFGDGEAWVSMTNLNPCDGKTVYEVTSPAGKNFTNVIFCRMNPSASANNWNNKWNQTSDLVYDGTKNLYTVKEGTWDKGNGTWSAYTYSITINAATGGTINVIYGGSTTSVTTSSETLNVPPKGEISVSCSPTVGYSFSSYDIKIGNDDPQTCTTATTHTICGNTTISATFREKTYDVTIKSSDTNQGSVSPTSVSVGQYTASNNIKATPQKGYKFVKWTATDGITITDPTSATTTIKATKAGTMTANFEALPPVTIYLKANGDWKAASALQYVKYNDIEYKLDNLGCYAGEYFTTEIPATVTNFTFLRKNPNNTSEVWNETAKLTVPTNDKVLYDMTSTNIKYIYLKPNDDWKKDGAKFEACFNSTEYIQLEDIGNGLYRCENKGGKVQFNRVDPNNGYNKWNQTSDLTILSDKNCFNITSWNGGEWDILWDDTFWTTYNAPNLRIHIEKILNGTVKLGTWTSGNTANDIDVPINSEFVLSITPAAGYVLKNCRIKIGDNAEEEGINGKSYTICGPTTLSAEFEIPVNEITITGKDRVYDGTRVDYNQNNGWVSGNGTESNPYTLYIDEAARITISPLPERTGLTAYYKFGTNTEQTDNVFDWETIGTTPTTLTVTAYYKDALGNKSIETQVTSPYFKMIPLPFYLMTSPNDEINIDRVAAGENIIVQFRSDAAASVGLFCRKNNEATEESLKSISQTTLYDYEYDVDNRIEPCVLHFIARAEEEVHGRRFIEEADIAIYRNVIIKINDPDGWVKNAYMWRDYSDAVLTQWPGDPVLQNFGTWRVFSVKYPYYDRFIVNDGKAEGATQTIDYVLPADDTCYELLTPANNGSDKEEDKAKYGLKVADCPGNLMVNDIEDVTIMEGEQIVVMPEIFVGLGYQLSDVEVFNISFDTRYIRAMQSGTNINIIGKSIGTSTVTVTYLLDGTYVEKTFNVTVKKNTHITIQLKVPVNIDPDRDDMEWVNNDQIFIRYWENEGSETNLGMTYLYTDDTYKYAQTKIPLGTNGKINFFFFYETYGVEGQKWRQTNWAQNITTSGCYLLLKDGVYYERSLQRDGDDCANAYQVRIMMTNGKTYTSNAVSSVDEILSFFAPGQNETGYRAGSVQLYKNGNMVTAINPATFAESTVYTATVAADGTSLENVEAYTGDYYIRTWGKDNWINNHGWNSVQTWTNAEKDSCKFTYFVSREGEYYNHYWVQTMNPYNNEGKDVSACVANIYNDDLAGKLLGDKNTNEYGDIKINNGKSFNVRFGYDPRTNYFGRAIIKGSGDNADYLNLHCNNAYSDANCTTKLPYGAGNSKTENKFRDISNWVYERDVYVRIDNNTPSASLYIEAKSPRTDANVTNHLLGYVTNEITGEETNTPIQRTVIGSGTTNGIYLMRVVYDFKTNRIIMAWLPQGTIDVTTEKTLNSDVLFLRKENEEVPQINLSSTGKINSLESMFFAMELERGDADKNKRHQEQYWFTLPFDCVIGSISGVHGYMKIWGIQRYRGDLRAEKGWFIDTPTFWEWMTPSDTLKAGEGYLLVFNKKSAPFHEFKQEDGTITSIMRLYFPSIQSGFDMQQQSAEHLTRTYEDHTCTITYKDRYKQDSNWKVIGTTSYNNAGINTYSKDSGYEEWKPEEDGEHVDVPNGHQWSAPMFRYSYTYKINNDNTGFNYWYTPEDGQTATYKSFYGYMVQFAGTINWQPIMSETVPEGIAARRYVPEGERTSFTTRLELTNAAGEKQDQAFVALDEKATTTFDQNLDLNKVMNNGTNIYTFSEGIPFAGNTLPMEKATVPVGVRIATTGEYTFRMPDGTEDISVTLVDNVTGTHTNMLLDEYTVTLPAGTIDNRFFLVVDPNRTATSVENVGNGSAMDDEATGKFEKFIINDQLIIRTADGIFDAQGHRL